VRSEAEPRDPGEQSPRCIGHPLSVHQMTRVVVADRGFEVAIGLAQPVYVEKLADITHATRERLGFVAEPVLRFAHRRATARRVHHDRIDRSRIEYRRIRAREFTREVAIPGVHVQRATAALSRRDHDIEAVAGQHTDRSRIDRTEEFGHHATHEEAHSTAPLALRRNEFRQRCALRGRGHPRQQLDRVAQSSRHHQGGRSIEAQPLCGRDQAHQ
jgi:hypothetical protein